VVKLKRQHQQPLTGIESQRPIVHAHRRRRAQRQDQHAAMMQRPAAPRAIEFGSRATLEAHDIIGQRELARTPPHQRMRRLRQTAHQGFERGIGNHFC